MKRFILAVVLASQLTTTTAAGIPTFDVILNSRGVIEFIKTAEHWRKTYVYWTNQLTKAQQLNDSLSGVRNLGDLFNNPALWQYLPHEFATLYRSMKYKGYGGILADGGPIWAVNKLFETCGSIEWERKRLDCEARAIAPSQNQATAEGLYKKQIESGIQIRELQGRINTTVDMAERTDLANRIAIAQLDLTKATNEIMIANAIAESDRRVMDQRQKEDAINSLKGDEPIVLIAPVFSR